MGEGKEGENPVRRRRKRREKRKKYSSSVRKMTAKDENLR